MVAVGRFIYHDHATEVFDGEGAKTLYRYDDKQRITQVEKYLDNALHSTQESTYDGKGWLQCQTLKDGTGKVCHKTCYVYDERGNILEETFGDENESYTFYRTYSNDGFNLTLSETDSFGKTVRYSYVPETNLLASELVYENEIIKRRGFFTYDDCAICIQKTVDDGSSDHPQDLAGITYRCITAIHPKQSHPCFGLPEIVEEKTLDDQGQEKLLSKVVYRYHPSGQVAEEDHYNADNQCLYTLTNQYDTKERLVAQTDGLGQITTSDYDECNNLIDIYGPREGMHKHIDYDLANRPIREKIRCVDGSCLTTVKRYNNIGKVIAQIDPGGFETCYQYDTLGRVTHIIHPDGAQESKEYDIQGNVIRSLDCNGFETLSEYNYHSKPTKVTHPDGSVETYTYTPKGTLKTHADRNGSTTHFTADIFDNPIKTEIYSSSGELLKSQTAAYAAFTTLSETDSEGVTTYYTYDFVGRKIGEKLLDRDVSYTYDSQGRLCKTQQGTTAHIEEYNLLGQIVEKRTEDLEGTLLRQEKYQYDSSGNRSHLITSKGVAETVYDHHNQPIKIIDPLGAITTIDYDYQDGLTTTTTDPKGIRTLQHHNSRGWVVEKSIQNPSGSTLHRDLTTYDPGGNPLEVTQEIYKGIDYSHTITRKSSYGPGNRIERLLESDLKETQYTYDACSRLQTLIKPDKTQIHHEYDELGRLTRYYADDIDYRYSYDSNDRLISVYDTISETTTARSYDGYGNLISETLANQLTLSNTYDPQGRRTQITLPDNSQIHYIYRGGDLARVQRKEKSYTYAQRDLEGLPTLIKLPAGQIAITYDKLSRQKSYQAPGYLAEFPDDAYDSVGNLCCYAHNQQEERYTYDDLNQLLTENDHNYQYDSLSNRLAKDDHCCTVNTLCQVTHDGEREYSYDLNGNLISDGKYTYAYDSLDRLVSVTHPWFTLIFTYDPFHRRIAKQIYQGCWQRQALSYLWDGENEIGTTVGSKIRELRVLGEGLGAEIGAACFIEIWSSSYVPIHDHRGSVVALQELERGKVVESYQYTAFGEEVSQGQLSPWRFASKRVDEETGFVYFGRRYYSPHLGKWITPDPQGFDDGPNLYAYLHNSPMSDFDLYGLYSWRTICSFSNFRNRSLNAFRKNVGKPHYNYNYEKRFANKSSCYDVNSSLGLGLSDFEGGRILFVNGMGTKMPTAADNGLYLAKMAGANVYGVHNETHGFWNDCGESREGLYKNTLTAPVFELQK
nr:tRNA3(Ser)-specific nuclease WapA [Chlamydiota bacterium]